MSSYVSAYTARGFRGCRADSSLGRVLAGPVFNEDVILAADIDLAEIARGKYDFDVVGHYARPDVFRLHVNEKPAAPVVGD